MGSYILAFEGTKICTPGEGCATVQNHATAFTFGIKNSLFGAIIFAILVILTLIQIIKHLKSIDKIIYSGIIISSIISIYFLYLQQFVIHAYCKYCLVVDFAILIALIILFFPKVNLNLEK